MMKTKLIFSLAVMMLFGSTAFAQRRDAVETLVATTEEDVYKIYDRMLDSARVSNQYTIDDPERDHCFGIVFLREMNSRDTMMLFDRRENTRIYGWFLSNHQPISFYKRLLNYLVKAGQESFALQRETITSLFGIRRLLIKRYESGELTAAESADVLQLMEDISLMMIKYDSGYYVVLNYPYVTDKIRKALIDVLDSPYYPQQYIDSYMDYQREHYPFTIDTVGIPNYVKEKVLNERYDVAVAEEDIDHLLTMYTWRSYKIKGEEWGGLSVEEAYWEKKRRRFIYTGYRSVIQEIAQYAHETQDKLIIKHLKQFKKKHPDYPLEYF